MIHKSKDFAGRIDTKTTLLSFLLLLAALNGAFAQPGAIYISSTTDGYCGEISDTTRGLLSVYIVHVGTPGATAAEFKVVRDSGISMTYLSETVTAPYIKFGSCAGPSATGCAIAYGSCVPSPNMILTILFFADGDTPTCCELQVVPDDGVVPPNSYVMVLDCADPPNRLNTIGGVIVVNPDGIHCYGPCYVPTATSTWGRIKSIYR